MSAPEAQYTPSTEDVAVYYVEPARDEYERRQEFDRWLEKERATAAAEALEAAAAACREDPARAAWLRRRAKNEIARSPEGRKTQ